MTGAIDMALKRAPVRRGLFLLAASLLLAGAFTGVSPKPAAAALCGQPTHIWWATPGGSLTNGDTVYVPAGSANYTTGVVSPGWPITWYAPPGFFHDVNGGGGVSADGSSFTTTPSDSNCVVHHQDNVVFTPDRGTYFIYADYADWEQNQVIFHAFVGTLVVY